MDATEHLIPFTKYTFPSYDDTKLHHLIATQLERVARGEVDRLMLRVPPRHGKSELASRRFPAWFLGRFPEKDIISASATGTLADDFGRDVRNIIASHQYGLLFDTTLAEDSKARGRWHTQHGGSYYAVGVGGNIMGRGGHIILIDDPFASMKDAQSETQREAVWEWYTGTLYNRLEPGGAIILINHRMHEDDLSGRIEAQQKIGGDEFEVVEFPAISDDGEALCPERYSIEQLERIRANTLPRFWSALYQQKPAPDEGTYFKREWFRWYDTLPTALRMYGASDYAVTEDGGDYTVHIVVGVDPNDDLYIVDLWRRQATSDQWVEAFLDLVVKHKPLNWAEESGQIIKSVGPFIVKRMRERKVYCRREQFTSVADKPTRSRAFQARAAMGKVYLPHNAPWVAGLVHELMTFPAGKNDDQVDGLGLVGRLLDQMISGTEQKVEAPRVDRWDRAFKRQDGESRSWKAL